VDEYRQPGKPQNPDIRGETLGAIRMSLTLYAHPFAAYCWKALIALYENATPFDYRVIEDERDAKGVADARKMLDVAYGWLERQVTQQEWAAGGTFSLADCSAAPALFYADWVYPIGDRFPDVLAYRRRVLARPSVTRVVDEARPYRKLFPQGAPDRG
jgi:glutathione S-transferase